MNNNTVTTSSSQTKPLIYETHSHTTLCKHATGFISDYADEAIKKNLKGLTVTCHCPLPNGLSPHIRMAPNEYDEYHSRIASTKNTYKSKLDILAGIEADFLPGLEPWLEKLLTKHPLHFVLGSIHPEVNNYRAKYFYGNWKEYYRTYFNLLAESAESRLFDSLSHPDIIKNVAPEAWDVDSILSDIEKALDRIAKTGVAMELNTSGLLKRIPEMNPSTTILEKIAERNIPLTLGADAHKPSRVAEHFTEALQLLDSLGVKHIHHFIERKPRKTLITKAIASLAS